MIDGNVATRRFDIIHVIMYNLYMLVVYFGRVLIMSKYVDLNKVRMIWLNHANGSHAGWRPQGYKWSDGERRLDDESMADTVNACTHAGGDAVIEYDNDETLTVQAHDSIKLI